MTVECSSGTYIRALARDLGEALGVGGHLTALRRTQVGPYTLDQARTLEQLADELDVLEMSQAARALMPNRELTDGRNHGTVLRPTDCRGCRRRHAGRCDAGEACRRVRAGRLARGAAGRRRKLRQAGAGLRAGQ